MKRFHFFLKPFFILLSLSMLSLGGCATSSTNTQSLDESRLPWGKPADWETQMPGLAIP